MQKPATPTQPAPAPTSPQQIVVPGPNGTQINIPVPMTRSQVRALQSRGASLSNQLESAQGRRDDLAQQLAKPNAVDRPGLEARIQQLDGRILNIENQIAENGQQLASIPANMRQSTSDPFGPFSSGTAQTLSQLTGLAAVALMIPFAVVWARRLWRRDSARPTPTVSPRWNDSFNRLERLEEAIGAIATEVERVSEGQRFMTQALGSGDGAFQPVRVNAADAVPVARADG